MKRLFLPVGSLLLALLIGVGALTARAKEPVEGGQPVSANEAIGSVDMEEVYNAAGSPQELDQAARQHEAEGAQRINKIMAVPYLEHNDLEEYGTLIGKVKMTPEEEKRAAALRAKNDQSAAELAALQTQQAPLNAADKMKLDRLQGLKQTLENQIRPDLIAQFRTQQEGWVAEYRHRQLIQLRQEVAKVAKEKKISHVFDAGTLVYSVNDLTPTVIQRLSKRATRRNGE
jgi:hypothetical protein